MDRVSEILYLYEDDVESFADGGRIGFDNGGTSQVKTDEFKYPTKFLNRKTGEIETVYRKEPVPRGAKRVSTNIDPYTKIVNDHNKAIQEALDSKDASKLPKSFAQTLREKGLKDGTYHHLMRGKKIPKARDVSTSRFDLAKKVIDDYNLELKFMEKEDVLKKANFTPKEIKVLSVQEVKKYPYRLPVADKAQHKVKKAFEEFFGKYGDPKYAETAYNDFYNPRELLSKATGLDVGTVSRVNLKSVDPKAHEVYKRLGQADIQKILDGDVDKSFFGSSLGDLKKYINEEIAKGKKPFQEFMYEGQGKTPTQLIKDKLDPEGVKTKRINPLKKRSGWDIAHSVKAGLLDPDKRGPQMKYETPDTLYPLKQELNRQRVDHTFRDTKHTAAENALTKIHNDRMKLMEQVEGDNFRVIPGKEREFAELQAKGKKIAKEFSYTDELFGTTFKGLPGTQQEVRGTVNFQIFNPDKKGIYKPENTTLVGGDTEKSLAKGLRKTEIAKKDIKKLTKPELKKWTDNTIERFKAIGILCTKGVGGQCNSIADYRQSFNELVEKAAAGNKPAISKMDRFIKGMRKVKGVGKWTGYGLLAEVGFMVPFAVGDYAAGKSWKRILGNATDYGFGPILGQSEQEEFEAALPEGSAAVQGEEALRISEEMERMEKQKVNPGYGRVGYRQKAEDARQKVYDDKFAEYVRNMQPFLRPSPHLEGGQFYDQELFDKAMTEGTETREAIARQDAEREEKRNIAGEEDFMAAGGGIAGIRRPNAIPPESGPQPQGLENLKYYVTNT